jgi:hypothetical protein
MFIQLLINDRVLALERGISDKSNGKKESPQGHSTAVQKRQLHGTAAN